MTDQKLNNEGRSLQSKRIPFALYLCIIGIIIGLSYHYRLWQLGDNGLSLATKTTPYWDFNNLWSGSKMTLAGHVNWLFDTELYREELRRTISEDIPDHEWGYPPSILLLGTILAQFSELNAYIIWTFGSIGLLFLACKTLKIPTLPTLAISFSPTVFYNAMYGQNAALTGALLIAGLSLAPRRPILAGVFIGLLTIKPQLGILIPFILIASGNWRTIISAGITAITLVLASGVLFGFDTWELFFSHTQPFMRDVMEAPHPQPYHINATTIFIAARSAEASLVLSYAIQGLASLACLVYAMRIWHKSSDMDHRIRVALTCVLTFLATPYAYTYDLVSVSAAIVIFYVLKPDFKFLPYLGVMWLFPILNRSLVMNTGYNWGGLALLTLLALMIWDLRDGQIGQGDVKLS